MSNVKTKITNKGVISEKIADTDTPTFSLEIGGSKGFGSKTRSEINLYVNVLTGSDDNKGTADAPLKTVAAAEGQIPDIVDHTVYIHISSGSYDPPTFGPRVVRNRVWLIGEDYSEALSSTSASAGSSASQVVGSGFSTDEFVGKTIEILSGDATGDKRLVSRNTTTTIIPSANFSSAISTGDLFRIVEPAVTFTTGSSFAIAEGFGGTTSGLSADLPPAVDKGLVLENINIHWGGIFSMEMRNSTIIGYGCYFTSDTLSSTAGSFSGIFLAGLDDNGKATLPVTDRGAPSNTSWYGWGLGSVGNTYFIKARTAMFLTAKDSVTQFSGFNRIYGGSLGGLSCTTSENIPGWCSLDSPLSPSIPKIRINGETRSSARASIQLSDCEIDNAGGNAMKTSSGGVLQVNSTVTVLSSSVALKVETGGVAHVGGFTINNATTNEIQVGAGPTTGSLSDVSTVGEFIDGGGGAFVIRSF